METSTTTRLSTFACRCGIKLVPGTSMQILWVRSPRTGRDVEIMGGWFGELPPRLHDRVVQAMAMGKPATFTRDELVALMELEKKIATALKPLPRGNGSRSLNSWTRR